MARSDVGRRLSLHEGVVAAVGLVLDNGEEAGDDFDDEPVNPAKKKEECSLETAVQVSLDSPGT
jgi:hypothetical protein